VVWTLEHTDERSKSFMRDLPFDLRFELAGKRVRLVHGSPRKVNEYLLEDRPERSFERIAQLAACDVLAFGHTHKPWVREYGGVLFVNCGCENLARADFGPRIGQCSRTIIAP
jgi:predicted phosphodiesterase